MKTILRRMMFLSFTMTLLFLSSCIKDENNSDTNFSAEDTSRAAITDDVVEGTLNIMENAYDENDGTTRKNTTSFFTDCTTITITLSGDSGTIVLDFGTSCQLNNGSIVSGIIRLEYGAFIAGTRTIVYTFEDYTYNGNGVSGGGEILREIANANGNPQSTVNETITVSFPNNNVTATRVGLRIAEWVEGVGSGTWLDNVYHVTGNWNTTFTNGFTRTGLVTDKLVLKSACLYLVSGVLQVEQEGFTAVLDFGNGTCDNLAILTINGVDYTIQM